MHEYYQRSIPKLNKSANNLLKYIRPELEQDTGKAYEALMAEILQEILAGNPPGKIIH